MGGIDGIMAVKGSTYIMSDSQKEAIKQSRKGYVPLPTTCERISKALMGHKVKKITREHISQGMMGNKNGGKG